MRQRVTSKFQFAGLLIVALGLAAPAPALAQDSAKSEKLEVKKAGVKAAKPKLKTTGRTFTNSDLDRMYGAVPENETPTRVEVPQPAPTGTSDGSDASAKSPLELMQDQQKNLRERQSQIAEAQANLASAKQRVLDLQKRRLAVVNPYLPRPKTPEDKKDADQWDGMDAKQRRDRTNEQLEEAKKAVVEAEQELAALHRGS